MATRVVATATVRAVTGRKLIATRAALTLVSATKLSDEICADDRDVSLMK